VALSHEKAVEALDLEGIGPGYGAARQSIIISKSQEIVDLTRALFAKFWVNGNQDVLVSRLD
jgi:hypothetical protein